MTSSKAFEQSCWKCHNSLYHNQAPPSAVSATVPLLGILYFYVLALMEVQGHSTREHLLSVQRKKPACARQWLMIKGQAQVE